MKYKMTVSTQIEADGKVINATSMFWDGLGYEDLVGMQRLQLASLEALQAKAEAKAREQGR
jgi:hypothetical protein